METLTSPILHLVDESLSGEEDVVSLKGQKVEIGGEVVGNEEPIRGDPKLAMAAPEGDIALGTETTPPSDVEIVPLLEVAVEGGARSEAAEVILRSDLSPSGQVNVPYSA